MSRKLPVWEIILKAVLNLLTVKRSLVVLCAGLSCTPFTYAKMLESGVNYDFDASGKASFSEQDSESRPVSWTWWHSCLDECVVAKQYELLLARWKSRGPAFAVIDYTVSSAGHIEARALKPDDPQYQAKFQEAKDEYRMSERTALTFSVSNNQFEQLTLKAYRSMEGNPLLKFPDGSKRLTVHDIRWHINSAKIKRSVRSQIDDVERH